MYTLKMENVPTQRYNVLLTHWNIAFEEKRIFMTKSKIQPIQGKTTTHYSEKQNEVYYMNVTNKWRF